MIQRTTKAVVLEVDIWNRKKNLDWVIQVLRNLVLGPACFLPQPHTPELRPCCECGGRFIRQTVDEVGRRK
jgi:hypothetical protein